MRYRFYREHKYLTALLFEVERLIAKTDFRMNEQVLAIKASLQAFADVLLSHAEHEEQAIHSLLQHLETPVQKQIEAEHQQHAALFAKLHQQLEAVVEADALQKSALGYDFYLSYRQFLIEQLQHFQQEETQLMPVLQQRYSDDELSRVDRAVYQQMTANELLEMLQILLPHMDANDKTFFLNDIQEAEPEKFIALERALA